MRDTRTSSTRYCTVSQTSDQLRVRGREMPWEYIYFEGDLGDFTGITVTVGSSLPSVLLASRNKPDPRMSNLGKVYFDYHLRVCTSFGTTFRVV